MRVARNREGDAIRRLAAALVFALTASLHASEPTEHPGTISGTVVSAVTGKPVAGAYVGIGDFGDAGGANLGRFRKQGLYATAQTDENGRFVLQGVAAARDHPLVVTHPEFVRHDRTITVGEAKPEIEVAVRLRPAAAVRATAVDGRGRPLDGPVLIRLEALDGRRFIPPGQNPHLSTFASSIWTQNARGGACSFGELDAGEYGVDAMVVSPSAADYHGGLPAVRVSGAEAKDVRVEPADHQTRVEINVPPAPPVPELIASGLKIPTVVVISRSEALLAWDDGRIHHPEDHRLGRIVQNFFIRALAPPGETYTVRNLPPGTYSVFAGPAVCMRGAKLEVPRAGAVRLDIPVGRPAEMARVSLWPLNRRVEIQEREYTAQELCELFTAKIDGKIRFEADPSIRDDTAEVRAGERTMWDHFESLYLDKGWKLDEQDEGTLVLLPESMAEKRIAARQGKANSGPPPIALLYHQDAQVRIRTIYGLAATGDSSLIDDLIRAKSAEFYTPVHNAYGQALRSMTGLRTPPGGGNWKHWLAGEVEAGRLQLDYLPLELDALDPEDRHKIQPIATRLGPKHFEEMAEGLRPGDGGSVEYEGLRYMVLNDHRPEVEEFLKSDWLSRLLAQPTLNINTLAYRLNGLANPGPLRDRINAQVRASLDSDDPTVVTNALHMLAGVEGFSTVFTVPDVGDRVRELLDSPVAAIAQQARRAMARVDPLWKAEQVGYEEAFRDLYETLGREYPCFDLKGIDWKAVGEELLPRVRQAETDDQFGLLCLELVARLEDTHASLAKGARDVPWPSFPRWDPGFACLFDDQQKLVVYYVDPGGPADTAGVRAGMTVVSIDGKPAAEAVEESMKQTSKYVGFSSDRYLRYQAARWFTRQMEKGTLVTLDMQDLEGKTRQFKLPAELDVRYLPRLPVPIPGIPDTANVSWTMLDGNVGYIYVRRIRSDLIARLDQAVGELKDARGLIVDVRGNSGGGFDSGRSHRNFDPHDPQEPDRPRFAGPIALLTDARCVSAGEGWASWFVARRRARVFGETTAGASSRKRTYTLKNGFYKVTFPVKAYRGFLDRPIERRGLEPDVRLRQNAKDIAAGRDTVLEAARRYLMEAFESD